MNQAQIVALLEGIRAASGGILPPEAVVEAARPAKHPLHGYFEWDDSEAAHQFRIEQARRLIRVSVRYEPGERGPLKVPYYVSLPRDRQRAGGGYRSMVEVLAADDQRAELLAEAERLMRQFEERFGHLQEVASVVEAMRAVRRR